MRLVPPAFHQALERIRMLSMPLLRSEQRRPALIMLGMLVAFSLTINWLNAYNSGVAGRFTDSLAKSDAAAFKPLALQYIGLFALCTVISVFFRFTEERLGLYWRNWLTGHLLDKYLANDAYYRLLSDEKIDNPDQRMTEDVRTFTATTLSFFLIFLNSTVSLITFAGILWSITPWLMLVAVVYAAIATGMSILLGRPLVGLNINQLRKEADLRYELIRLRENAEAIALMRNEIKERDRLGQRLQEAIGNFRSIISVNRNLNFFTTGYNYLNQVLPALIVAPMIFRGELQYGAVVQGTVAFGFVLGAFSVIVNQFQAITSFVAVVTRVGSIWEAIDADSRKGPIEVVSEGSNVVFDNLTLITPKDGRALIHNLNVTIEPGRNLLITGPNGTGKSALFSAAAGLWQSGSGRIARPPIGEVMFLPQKPYMMLGTIREQILCGNATCQVATDQQLKQVITDVKLGPLLDRVGGLDIEQDWANILSLGEQRQIAIARLLIANPRFAFIDIAFSAPDAARRRYFSELMARSAITIISISDDPSLAEIFDQVLELAEDGKWSLRAGGNVRPG